tara:strand:- start:77 stop:487 length:411 start_codon:yes stop_codon:yes gene_type:complete
MAFKMKGFGGFGNSPMKQKGFIRTPDGFDHAGAKRKAKKAFERLGAKSGHGTIKDLQDKAKTKMVKQTAKKGLGALARIAGRASGVGTILSLGYQAYKAGQKKSGGKINPNQKSIIKEGKKKIDRSKFNASIYNKK